MAQPQIQYTSIAEPPAFTPPATAALGWRLSYPQGRDVRRAALHPSAIATAVNIFAIERWTIPQGAATETPDNPQQFIPRLDLRARGGGYRAALNPQLIGDEYRNLTVTTPLGWGSEIPDDPRLGRRVGTLPPGLPLMEFGVELDTPVESWTNTLPEDPRLGRKAARLPEFPSPSGAVFAIEQWSIPPESWDPSYPDRPVRAKGLPDYTVSIWPTTTIAVAPAPANSWQPSYPDRVWKAARLSDYPAFSALVGLEQFRVTMAWAPIAPERLTRPRQTQDAGTVSPPQQQAAPPILGPDMLPPVRVVRRQQTVPVQNVLPQGNPAAPTLSWKGQAPDRVWRLVLPTALQRHSVVEPSLAPSVIADYIVWVLAETDTIRIAADPGTVLIPAAPDVKVKP